MSADFQLETPVVLLLFSRPACTAAVFDRVREARPPEIFIVQDAPRAHVAGESLHCAEVRAIAGAVDWPCKVHWNVAAEHMGCMLRVSSGLSWVFSLTAEAIVLEDDCLPHPAFFRYCQELLERYRDDQRIFSISGDNFNFGQRVFDYSYHFSLRFHCWGWASWRRSWRSVDLNLSQWPSIREGSWLEDVVGHREGASDYRKAFDACRDYGADTWAYRAAYSSVVNGRLNIHPGVNLVTNIGFGPGAHSGCTTHPLADIPVGDLELPLRHPPFLMRDFVADRNAFDFIYNPVEART